MQLNYKEQLADSRWLQKKAEILIRDNYACQKCGAKSHLNVHHLSYENGKLAWEYPNEQLITLCKDCHENEHLITKPIIGEVYAYDHSDFTNYMICYGINYIKKEVYLLGYDTGGAINTTHFECWDMDMFCERFIHCIDLWAKLDEEEDFITDVLLQDLVRLYENPYNNFYEFFYFTFPEEMIIRYARKSLGKILSHNITLKRHFENEIQGFFLED